MQEIEKIWKDSLKFLDNKMTHTVLTIVLVLLVSTLFTNINRAIVNLMENKFLRILVVLLIVYFIPRSPTLGVLLAIFYVMSLRGVMEYFAGSINEAPVSVENPKDKEERKKVMDEVVSEVQANVPVEEHFIPFLTNRDFETGFDSELKSSWSRPSQECLSTDPSRHEIVGDACKPVGAFRNELNAQGMNDITGFNINHQMTAKPL
jgi:hypothetical protein